MLLWIALHAQAAEALLALGPRVETLDNGLTVILSEDHRTDTIALHLLVQVGARDEGAPGAGGQGGEFGCAHLFEHLMFEGSEHVPTNAFDTWLTAAGGQNNAYTTRDLTAYVMDFPSGALDLALFLESDRMGFLEPGLIDENLRNQAGVVLQERAEGYAEPNGRDFAALSMISWAPDHPYHHPVIGTVADIEGFTVPATRRFWERHYRPSNAALVLVGRFDSDQALERVRHWFSDVPDRGAPVPRQATAVPAGVRGARGVLFDRVEERTVYLVWGAVPDGHPDEPGLDLLTSVLSGGRGTRLDDRLYHQSGLASQVGMFSFPGDLAGQVIAYASSPVTPLAELERRMLREIDRVAGRAPRPAELERARSRVLANFLDSLESPSGRAQLLAECFRLTGDADCLQARWEQYEAVTVHDLQRLARQWLAQAEPARLSVVPEGDGGALPGSEPVELP